MIERAAQTPPADPNTAGRNPFQPEGRRVGSACLVPDGAGSVLDRHTGRAPDAPYRHVHDLFRSLMLSDTVPCIAGRGALRSSAYWHAVYGTMVADTDTQWLCTDLFDFVQAQEALPGRFSTFVASFLDPPVPDEATFEDLLWRQVALLHDRDRQYHAWDPANSPDPAHPRFGFSIAGRAFFIVGLNPAASRRARRFAWPTLVFNAEFQFDVLETTGEMDKFQRIIRDRDVRLQGSVNPNLIYEGEISRARQYSGRAVPLDWRCPWRPGADAAAAAAADPSLPRDEDT